MPYPHVTGGGMVHTFPPRQGRRSTRHRGSPGGRARRGRPRPRHAIGPTWLAALLVVATGCTGNVPLPKTSGAPDLRGGNPLGPSYVLIPVPNEDAGLLGRILPAPPAPGRSLDETARANPCADKLTVPTTVPMAS